MGLKLRGGVWHIDLTHGGKRLRESTETSDRKLAELKHKEAEVALWRGERSIGAPKGAAGVERTLAGYFERAWSIHFRKLKSADSVGHHFKGLGAFIPLSSPLATLSTPLLSDAASRMADAGVAPGTINRRLAVVSKLLRLAHAEHPPLIDRMPSVPFVKEPEGRLRFLSEQEAEDLRLACTGALRLEVDTLMFTGMRLGELLSLERRNVDLDGKRLDLWDTKTGRRRWVPLPEQALEVLRLALRIHEGGPLFPRPRRTVQREFSETVERLGMEDVVIHTLRHTYGTRLMAAGVDVRTVMALMGHESISTTMRYAHAVDARLTAAIDVFKVPPVEETVPRLVTKVPHA